MFARVRELAKKMLQENHYASEELKAQKEYLDHVCRSFASRMERRRDLSVASSAFHRNANDVSRSRNQYFSVKKSQT